MSLEYTKKIEILRRADVIVSGGGPAGVAAAVSAARLGQKTVLLEQSGSLGGSSALAMVPELMNFDDGAHFISGGIGREIFERLGYSCEYGRKWYNVRVEELKRIYDDLVTEAGVEVLFYSRVADAMVTDGRVTHVIVSGPAGLCAAEGKFFIDCTGSGSLACFAGAEHEYGDENGTAMSATICSLWGGIDFSRKERDANNYKKAYADGIFSQYDTALAGIKANYPEAGVGFGNVGHCFGVDDRDVTSLSKAMLEGRKTVQEYIRYYREYVPGCENAALIKTADFIGIRESRRICCAYMLCENDFFAEGRFPDEIGRYSYPIDIHPMTADKSGMDGFYKSVAVRHEDGGTYSIPYRSLVPLHTENMLVAGRCIGADHRMQASVRVIPCCYITGQAAGTAAALCLADGVPAIGADTEKLRAVLRENGAYLYD